MSKRLLSLAVAGSLLLGLAGAANAGVPDATLSSASSAGSGTLLLRPNGAGNTLGAIGCTVTVTVLDATGTPIAGYPFQDIYLDDPGTGEITLCQGGSTADTNTNASGVALITGAIAGGGWTQNGLQVYLAGVGIGSALPINANSPDINGDLTVNLGDVGDFSADFGGPYNFRSDFQFDLFVNLGDVGTLSEALGDVCP
jgi:hypothetical protein